MNENICILQVEDDENDVFLLRHAFKAAGIENTLRVARDGQEAIDYLGGQGEFADRERFPLPCLILLDLKLPRRTGLEVLEWLRRQSHLASLPVIIFSSSNHRSDIDQAYQLGTNAFITKPSGQDERIEFARAIRNFWLRFNQTPVACHPDAAKETPATLPV